MQFVLLTFEYIAQCFCSFMCCLSLPLFAGILSAVHCLHCPLWCHSRLPAYFSMLQALIAVKERSVATEIQSYKLHTCNFLFMKIVPYFWKFFIVKLLLHVNLCTKMTVEYSGDCLSAVPQLDFTSYAMLDKLQEV